MLRPAERFRDYFVCALALGTSPRGKWSIFWKQTKNIRVHLRLGSYEPDKVYSLKTVYGPLFFRDNFGDITNLVDLFYRQEYRVREISQEGVILDIGANIGLAAVWFVHYNPGKMIYCFEPLGPNVELIKLNCPDAQVVQVGVGGRTDRVKLRVDRDNVMASRIPCKWDTHEVEFDVITLDDFVGTRGVEQVSLMKIDVEGMEDEVLQGGQQTLEKTYQVVMETHSHTLHHKVIQHLQRAGFYIDSEHFNKSTGLLFASRRKQQRLRVV